MSSAFPWPRCPHGELGVLGGCWQLLSPACCLCDLEMLLRLLRGKEMGDKAALNPQRGAQPSWELQGAARSTAESKDRVNLQPRAQLLPVRVELHLAGGSSTWDRMGEGSTGQRKFPLQGEAGEAPWRGVALKGWEFGRK